MTNMTRLFRHYLLHSPHKLGSLLKLIYTTKLRSAKKLRGEDFASSLPPLMTIQVNNLCNLRCIQCWEWGTNGAYKDLDTDVLNDELSTEQWKSFIEEISNWKPYLYFTGGEPLLRKDLAIIIGFASGKGMLTALNSNTTLLTEERADSLVRAGLDYYIASLDGPEEINNRIRRGADVYNKIIAGINRLVETKQRLNSPLPVIEACLTITTDNYDHLLETAEIVNGLGVDRFKIQMGMFTTREALEGTKSRLMETFGVRLRLWEGYLRDVSGIDSRSIANQEGLLKSKRWNFQFGRYPRLGMNGIDIERYYANPEIIFGEKLCHVPWKQAIIRANGDVVGCPWFPEVILGNIHRQRFTSIWNGFEMRKFRRTLTENGLFDVCSRCCELYEHDESKG